MVDSEAGQSGAERREAAREQSERGGSVVVPGVGVDDKLVHVGVAVELGLDLV